MIYVLVTASRRWEPRPAKQVMGGALCWVMGEFPGLIVPGDHGPRGLWHEVTIVHGAADGGDTVMDQLARAWGMHVEPYPVTREEWNTCVPTCNPTHRRRREDRSTFCPTAGTRRNQRMVNLHTTRPYACCLGFPIGAGWSGTRHCMTRADAAGIRTLDWSKDGEGR